MQKPRCPKCGETVSKAAVSSYGKVRYQHTGTIYRRDVCNWNGTNPVGIEKAEAEGIDRDATARLHAKIKGRKQATYVITAAQNATPINKLFLESLLTYCRHRGAELLVVPYRYKNPTSRWSDKQESDDWWAAEVVPHLIDRRVQLNKHLILLGDIKTQPTASRPLMGFETISGGCSAIIGHAKQEIDTVPTPQSRMAKIMASTGAVTARNYIPSKAGKKAEHHHTHGAIVVEVDGDRFHLRQINAVRDGSFIDLDYEYAGAKVRRAAAAEGIVLGDLHDPFTDPAVIEATFTAPNSMVKTLRPKRLVFHDADDFYARNHHHLHDPFIGYAVHHAGQANVERELDHCFASIDRLSPAGTINVLVPSNHPDALGRWVKETNPNSDPENALFWCRTRIALYEATGWSARGAEVPDAFTFWARRKMKSSGRTVFLGRGESYLIKGIDIGHHGDQGANGARGSRAQFSRIGVKTIIGHSHSPGYRDGCMQVGTSSLLRLGYNAGIGSWLQAHGIIYGNGKRTLAFIIDGKWRGKK